jgi:aminoglycoside phosphotransferase family enzyme/predicted kinase
MHLSSQQMERQRQASLFAAMSRLDFYPHPVRYVTQKDTHISKVFLTGDYVYKIKKAVDLGFLDFSSLAKRHRCCKREVTLNRRLTRRVYLGVIPITWADGRFSLSGSGREVEFAVRMRQLPEACSLAALIEQNQVTVEQIETLASILTEFYVRQGSVSRELAADSRGNVKAFCQENFRQTQGAVGRPLNAQYYQAVRSATDSFLTRRKTVFKSRSDGGKICHGHGDLRTSHIYYTGPDRIQVIDCIEFNSRLRHIDIASDLAFLIMDLDFRGVPGLGSALLDVYVRQTGDWQVYALLPFYKCYRAMVRCKVNCIRMKANHCGGEDLTALHRRAGRYLALAHRYAEHFERPTVWVLCGLPGSGKSSIARILSKKLDLTTLRSDVIRKQLFGPAAKDQNAARLEHDIYSTAAHRRTYGELMRRARSALQQKNSVILDATFSHADYRRQVLQLADDFRSRAVFIECTAPDNVLQARLRQREGRPSVSDARQHHLAMLKQRYVPTDKLDPRLRLQVDTTQPINSCLHAMLSWDYKTSLGSVVKAKTAIPDLGAGGDHVQDNFGSNRPSHRTGSGGGNGCPSGRRKPRSAFHPPHP